MGKAGSKTNATLSARAITALVVGALAVTTLGGWSQATPKAAGTPTPATMTVVPVPAGINPLTGIEGPATGPVIAVKIDDTARGRPTLGLEKADVIYIEEVEGGLSRMMAMFASATPNVRAVRSVRSSDIELLGQYGSIILVASGGAGVTLRKLDASNLHSVINDRRQVGFFRDSSRPAPYNVVSQLALVSAAIQGEGVRDVGFTWAADDPRLAIAQSAPIVSTRVGTTAVDFVWDGKLASYVRTVAGLPILTESGDLVAKPNVLVQFCEITVDSSVIDANGNPTKFTESVGTGQVVLFRDGKRIAGTWSRPSLDAPTTFTDTAGKPLLFAPGGAFVALARPGTST